MKFSKKDILSAAGALGVLAIAFVLFNKTSNDAGKAWDIRWGYHFILTCFIAAVIAFAYNAKDLWARLRSHLPSRPAMLGALVLTVALGFFVHANIYRQHRVLSDENSWTSMGLEMHYNSNGGVCNQGFWENGKLNCTDVVTNFKGKTLALVEDLMFYVMPSNRDTALALNYPLYLASLLFFFFALYRFLGQEWIALAATAFLGCMPILMLQAQSASTEVLYIFLLNLLLLIYSLVPPSEVQWKHLLLIIPILGLFSGTRQETVFCFIPFALYYQDFLRKKPWHLAAFTALVILASWPAVNTMAAYRGYDFQGGSHDAQSLSNLWYNLQSNIGIMMKPGEEGGLLKNPFYPAFTALWLITSLWLIVRIVATRKYLWGGILMALFHLQSLVILINVSGTFEIDINERYVLIALPSFAWLMALGLHDFLATAPAQENPLRKQAILLTLIVAIGLSAYLTISHADSFRSNMLYKNNKLLTEEDYLNTELKKLPPNSIFIYSRPWQMICSGFNAFSENTLLGWSDQDYAKWLLFSNNNVYLVRGQDGFGAVDRTSRVVGFKTTEPIERIMTEYANEKLWSNSKDFGYPLTVIHVMNRKGHSRFSEGLVVEPDAYDVAEGKDLQISIRRAFADTLPFQWSLDNVKMPQGSLAQVNTSLNIQSSLLKPGIHTLTFDFYAPQNDTVHVVQDIFAQGKGVVLIQGLTPMRQTQSWGTAGMGKTVDGNSLKNDRRTYGFGIGAHANSSIMYKLEGRYKKFHSIIGLDDEAACGDGAVWIVRGDQKVLFTSEHLTSGMKDSANVDISGVQTLELETNQLNDNHCDHTDWINPWLE